MKGGRLFIVQRGSYDRNQSYPRAFAPPDDGFRHPLPSRLFSADVLRHGRPLHHRSLQWRRTDHGRLHRKPVDAHADRHHRRARHGDDRLHQPRGGRRRSEGSLLLHRKLGATLCPLQPRRHRAPPPFDRSYPLLAEDSDGSMGGYKGVPSHLLCRHPLHRRL